jgi:hypothetical protein
VNSTSSDDDSSDARGFAGTQEELETLLAEGLASKEVSENKFWHSVNTQTDALLAEHSRARALP